MLDLNFVQNTPGSILQMQNGRGSIFQMSNAARMFTTDGRPVLTSHSRVEFTTDRTGKALSE